MNDRPVSRAALSMLLDMAILFLAAALLILPLFRIEYFSNWMSIEGAFIADARYIRDHWPHPSWHALWYCGNRFDYVYAPGTRYGAAMASMLLHVSPARGYHIFIAVMYCLGAAGVYFLVRTGSGSRGGAWLAACASALLSPVFLILRQYREDSLHWMPQRLNVLIKWGEGPHMCAMAIIPFALGFSLLAFRNGSRRMMAAAACCCAAVVLNNLYGALALGVFFPILVWSVFITKPGASVWRRAAIIVLFTAGLCAWWLTPSFLRLTQRNLMLVAQSGNRGSELAGVAIALGFVALSRLAARRWKLSAWPVFLAGSLLFFAVEVFGQFFFHFRITGEPMRFVPELDLLIILAIAEGIRRLWAVRRWAAAVVAIVGFSFSANYLSAPWSVYSADLNYTSRIEYRMPEWVAKNLPGSRLFTFGSVSFWYTTWRDLPEANGGSDQGAQTLLPPLARYQIRMGNNTQRDIYWLQALGVDAVMFHEPPSEEIYHEVKSPRKFMGILPVIYDHHGDIVYRVPRQPGLARVVDEQRISGLQPIPWSDKDENELRAYAQAVEEIKAPIEYRRPAIDQILISAQTGPGQSVLVQENYDPGWSAWVDGKPTPIEQDIMQFMRVRPQPGAHEVRFTYGMAPDARAGMWISTLSLLILAGFVSYRRVA